MGTSKPVYAIFDQLMDEMDPVLLDLVKTTVNSFAKWDLVRFYSENPYVIITPEAMTRRLKCDLAAVTTALEELAGSGLLQKFSYDEVTSYYALATGEQTKALVDRFIVACEDGDFRVKTVYHITQGCFRA